MTGMGAALNVAGMVSPIGRGLVNTQLQYTTNKENRRFALEQQRLQNQFNLDMWNRQNAYNTPAAQVQRLMAAGLNPNLAYGQLGAGEAGALTSAGANYKGEAPQLSGDFAGSVQSFMSNKRAEELHQKQMTSMDLDNEKKAIDNEMSRQDLDDYSAFKLNQKEQRETLLSNMRLTNEQLQKNLVLLSDAHESNVVAISQQMIDLEFSLDWHDLQIDDMNASIDLKRAQEKLTNAQKTQALAVARLYSLQAVAQELENKMKNEAYKEGYNPYREAYRKVEAEISKLSADTDVAKATKRYQDMVNADTEKDLVYRGINSDENGKAYIDNNFWYVVDGAVSYIGSV